MKYLSKNGCLFYFDRALYSWKYCEPTMLFLLGFESVTAYDNSLSDTVKISKYAYHSYDGTLEAYKDFSIFDRIYGFLSLSGEVEDNETYSDFKCNGIKLLINDLTGVSVDRTIPIIFKNDINTLAVDLSQTMNRLSEQSYINYSINDLRAQKISDIFDDAKYSNPNYRLTDLYDLSRISDTTAIKIATAYNDKITSLHNERVFNSNIYKLIDYKAMYSYALGVLYGCRCLGYDANSIWRLDPKFWYNGLYTNLVETAWETFRFHYTNIIDAPSEHYQDIVLNKLWNYINDGSYGIELKSDELTLASVSIEAEDNNKSLSVRSIVYSDSSQEYIPLYTSSTDLNNWLPVDSEIIASDNDVPIRDLIDPNGKSYIRYIGTSPVKLFPAYRSKLMDSEDYKYPFLESYYFTDAGNLGWVKYNPNDFNTDLIGTGNSNPSLSIYPIALNKLSTSQFSLALEKSTSTLVAYYKCDLHYLSLDANTASYELVTSATLYGFTDGFEISATNSITVNNDASFYNISYFATQQDFEDEYIPYLAQTGCIITTVYDLSNKLQVVVKEIDQTQIWQGGDIFTSMYEFGYSNYASSNLQVYIENENNEVVQSNIRYYIKPTQIYYWEPKEIYYNGFIPYLKTSPLPDGNYFLLDNASLYKNINKLHDEISVYSNEIKVTNDIVIPKQNPTNRFVYIDDEFVSLNILHDEQGITEYLCPIIYEDDFGNSLLDLEGNPAVWYDEYKDKYWNGLLSTPTWQTGKPVLNGLLMYDAALHTTTSVVDNEYNHTITINGNVITYQEFYSHIEYGLIRNILHVYSNISGMVDCFYDSYSDEYCIPNVTSEWTTRSDITDLGYRFVDGTEVLYNGNNEVEVIIDNNDED